MPLPLVIAVLLIGTPILEIWVIIQVGHWIGAWPTVALLLLESALGAWLIRREGRRTWHALRDKMRVSLLPSTELLDSGLVLIGGTLLLAPGFVTDIFGFALVLPFTRPLVRKLVTILVLRRFGGLGLATGLLGTPFSGRASQDDRLGQRGGSKHDNASHGNVSHDVVEGEVIEGRTAPDSTMPPHNSRP